MMDAKSELSTYAGPVTAQQRIEFVDILRGFAVLGILVANMAGYSGLSTNVQAWSDTLDRAILILTRFWVEAKFYSLFSFLFGWGMAVQLARAQARSGRFVPLFVRRMLILLAFGLIHGLFIWSGDILSLYAVYGLLLLAFRNRSERGLLLGTGLALLLSIVVTLPGEAMGAFRDWYQEATAFLRTGALAEQLYATGTYRQITGLRFQEVLAGRSWFIYTFGNIFGMFLLGLYVGKRRIFHNIDRHLSLVHKVVWLGLVAGAIFNGLYVWVTLRPHIVPPDAYMFVSRGARTIGAPALMLFYVSAIILLYRNQTWRQRLAPLAAVGRMALSNYLLQSVLCTLIFYSYGLGLYGRIDPLLALILTILILVAQIRFSQWWLERYRFGPMEWVWRSLTYGRWQALGRRAATGSWREIARRRVYHFVGRVNHRMALTGIWIVLLLWAAALGVWYIRLERAAAAEVPSVSPSATPDRTAAQPLATPAGAEPQAGSQPEVVATPVVQPVVYEPGPVAASGNLQALAESFSVESALAQIEILTGPPFWGRYTGSPQAWAAGDYIAAQFARYGLQPAGDNGTFFQSFPVEYITLAEVPRLELEAPGGQEYDNYRLYHDFSAIVRDYLGPGSAEGGLVWAAECRPGDFSTLNVQDKIVLCRSTDTAAAGRNALEYGAVGLLLVTDPGQRLPDFGTTYFEPLVPEPIPAFRVYPPLVTDLLAGSGHSFQDLSTAFSGFELDARVRMSVTTEGAESCPAPGCQGRNVLGVLPGRDPAYADRVVILGAHYDHLGQSPDGTVWRGANDDASGVAALLELARAWHEAGYVPRYTVLFAAWDAEEEGLLGSRHYVQHPRYPLDSTAAMFQFDMIGAGGDTLWIDGGGELAAHLHSVAGALDVDSEITAMGRSDHVPFMLAGVPASLLIWRFDQTDLPQYHRPVDVPANIEPEKFGAAVRVASLAMLGMIEGEAAIDELLARRASAIHARDLEAFLSTSSAAQHDRDRSWFVDLASLSPVTFALEAAEVRVLGRDARATVRMTYETPASGEPGRQAHTSTLDVRFVHDGIAWRWAGPDLVWIEGQPGFAVAHPSGDESGLAGLGQRAAMLYADLAARLGLPPEAEATLELYPRGEMLRMSTAPSLSAPVDHWLDAQTIKLTYSPEISTSHQLTSTLAQLVLAKAGVTEAAAPWLWQGLPLVWRAARDPVAAHGQYLPRLQQALAADAVPAGDATAWAAVDYLRQQLGWQGLGQFIVTLGNACREGRCPGGDGLDLALRTALQVDANEFQAAWQGDWRRRLADAQAQLDTLLQARTTAVLGGDEAAFLATVDSTVPELLAEERLWFAAFQRRTVAGFSLSGRPVALREDGGLWAEVTLQVQRDQDAADGPAEVSMPLRVHVSANDGGLRWAGYPLDTLQAGRVRVLYPSGQGALAQEILQATEELYLEMAAGLDASPVGPLTVKLYDRRQEFRAGISPLFPLLEWLPAWTGPEGAVKVWLPPDADLEVYRPLLAVQIARHLLQQRGVQAEWLLMGASLYLAGAAAPGAVQQGVTAQLDEVLAAWREDTLPALDTVAADDELAQEEIDRVRARVWDLVRYLVNEYGYQALLDLVAAQGQGLSGAAAVQATTGRTLAEFEADWAESLGRAHLTPEEIELATAFDSERAIQHIIQLSSPGLAGRAAGSPGARKTAAYIAGRFAEYGLQPAGEDGTFFQSFPITYTTWLAGPSLQILTGEGSSPLSLAYREDFLASPATGLGEGPVASELVWVRDGEYQDLDLAGKVVLREPSQAARVEAELAQQHGAGALILAGTLETRRERWAKTPLAVAEPVEPGIPVLQLTKAGYDRLLDSTGRTREELHDSPPALPLGINVRVAVPLSAPATVQSANVLAVLPGADPELAQQVIVVGAHYDHVGDDPPDEQGAFLRYPGANDDASGVAVLLEMARLWQAAGYRPRRTVLLAAWGAQELGELGSRHYAAHPVWPLEQTVAMLQLDAVGGGDGYYLEAQGGDRPEGLMLFNLQIADEWSEGRLALRSKSGRSDQLPFREAGIPTLLITWRGSSEDNLPDELADEIDPYRLGVTGRFVAMTVMAAAR